MSNPEKVEIFAKNKAESDEEKILFNIIEKQRFGSIPKSRISNFLERFNNVNFFERYQSNSVIQTLPDRNEVTKLKLLN